MSNGIIDKALAQVADNNPELLKDIKDVMTKVDSANSTLKEIKKILFISMAILVAIALTALVISIVRGRSK